MKKEKDLYQISLKAIIKNNKGEILFLKAIPEGSYAGCYDLPGGRINTDEFTTPYLDILKREIAEEIGSVKLTIHAKPVALGRHCVPASLSRKRKEIHVLYLFFEAKYISGKITISSEHTNFKWIDISKEKPKKFLISGILEGIQMYISK